MPSAKNDRHADDVAARQSTSIPAGLDSELPDRLQARPRGGRHSRNKGIKAERALVRFLQEHGFAAERVPLSGSAGGRFVGDLAVPLLGVDRCVEVKCRANGFRKLYVWLDGRDLLIVRADRREPLVVLPLRLAAEIARRSGAQAMTAQGMLKAALGAQQNKLGRAEHDYYPTPVEVTRALLPEISDFPSPIWEPACGDGAIARELERGGFTVIGTDIVHQSYGEGD